MNYVHVSVGKRKKIFLLDTGASISIIFRNELDNNDVEYVVNGNERINVKGISGTTTSIGTTHVLFTLNDRYDICHKFHVIQNSNCEMHGVLGADFFYMYRCGIDYEKFTFSLFIRGSKIFLQLQSNFEDNIIMPSRCEVVTWCTYDDTCDCVVLPEDLCEGVYVAGVIATPIEGKIPVRILNTSDREVKIRNFTPRTESLSKFECYNFETNSMTVSRVDSVLDKINTKSLSREEKTSIEKICAKYADVFHLEGDPLTVTNLYKHKITLKENTSPVYVKPYRIPQAQKAEVHEQVTKLLKDDIIEEARSEWSSPLLIVPKKSDSSGNKKWRVVIDYRLLNKNVQDEKFPLPCISEILDSLSGAIYFSHLDLAQGYYQLELEKSSRQITAFTTDKGQFQLKRLPMGLKISPSAFSRLMTVAMSGLNYESCFIYLDDVIIFGNTLQNHNLNLIKVLERLRETNLKLNPGKCEFLKKQILYLGHLISSEGILPDPEKTRAIRQYPIPGNSKETKRFVAFCNYYRKFIKNFAQIAQPLNNMSRKGKVFEWTEDCQKSFETLRELLINSPILQYPDFSESNNFILRTDASGYSVGSVLSNGDDRPVAYASRVLNQAEKRYCTIEKELLAIVWSVNHFRPYLYGKKFTILSDHKPLMYLFGMKNPTSRLTKFRLALAEYDFTVEYVTGASNVTADALSRISINSSELKSMCEETYECVNVLTRAQARKREAGEAPLITKSTDEGIDQPAVVELLKHPKGSIELRPVSEAKIFEMENLGKATQELNIKYRYSNRNKNNPERSNLNSSNNTKYFFYDVNSQIIYFNQEYQSMSALGASLRSLDEFCANNQITELCIVKNAENSKFLKAFINEKKLINRSSKTKTKICIIKDVKMIDDFETRQLILNDFHNLPTGGHAGINRMYNNIKKYYFWNGLNKDVNDFVKRCDECQRFKYCKVNKEPMVITTTASYAFQKVALDLVGPLNNDCDNRYILTLQCDLTKFVEGYPLPNKESKTVAEAFVNNFILRYGIPAEVLTDQGTEFLANVFRESCSILGIKQLNSTAYHHETLGALENSHKHLAAYLRIQLAKYANNWSSWVPYWCFVYNNSVHTETRYTPHELVFGKLGSLPSNVISNRVEPIYNVDDYPKELKYRLQVAWNDAKQNLIQSKITRKEKFNDKLKNIGKYRIGSKVLVKNETITNKIGDEIFKGPYTVLEDKGPNVTIDLGNKRIEVHKNRIRNYYS